MSEPIHRRTSIVTIEVQLWPPPPVNGEAWWWGHHDLSFHLQGERDTSWTEQINECALKMHHSPDLFLDKTYGWILKLSFSHHIAEQIIKFIMDTAHATPPKLDWNDRDKAWWGDDWLHPNVAKNWPFTQFQRVLESNMPKPKVEEKHEEKA